MEKHNRDGFQSRWGFILACIGSAVGMGNIWRFPIMVSKFGGLTFLIPYILFVVLIASTGVIEEFALGRAAGRGPVGAFGMCTENRYGNRRIGEIIGALPVLGSLMLAIGYTVVLGWIIKYCIMGITGELYSLGTDMAAIGGAFGAAAPEADTLPAALSMMLGGLFTIGNGGWLLTALVLSLVIMALGISGGIERANKLLMPALFFLFVILGIYLLLLPGAGKGYSYIFTLDPKGLADPQVWIYAFGQAFFSLSIAGNGSVIYGSYLSREEDIPKSAGYVALFDTLAAVLAMLVILPSMAVGGVEPSAGGPGLMFVYLVYVFNGMAGGRWVGMIFFLCVLFAGVSSIINLYETPVAFLREKLKWGRVPSVAAIGVLGGIVALLIQPVTSQWMDVVSIYICPLGAFLAAVMFFWVLKKEDALAAVNWGAKKGVFAGFYPLGKYVFCAAAVIALIAGAVFGGIG